MTRAKNVFISWSMPRGRKLAEALRQFLPDVIEQAEPFISDDIEKGSRWNHKLASILAETKVGIICLTPESLSSRWLLYEAGALVKALDTTHVCPYLLGLEHKDLESPLADFQATKAEKQDTFRLVETLNMALGCQIDAARLQRRFKKFWPDLARRIEGLSGEAVPDAPRPVRRSTDDVLEEILAKVRNVERRLEDVAAGGGCPGAAHPALPPSPPPVLKEIARLLEQKTTLVKQLLSLGREQAAAEAELAKLEPGAEHDRVRRWVDELRLSRDHTTDQLGNIDQILQAQCGDAPVQVIP